MERPATERHEALFQGWRRIGQILVSSLDLDHALGSIVDETLRLIDADVALLRLLDRPGEQLELHVARGVPAEAVRLVSFHPGEGLAGRLLLDGVPLHGLDMKTDPRTRHLDLAVRFDWQAFIVVAIHLHQQPIGIWFLIRHSHVPFSAQDIELLQSLADYASLAIERSWLLQTIVQEKHESEAVVDASASGIMVVDRYGYVVSMNPAMERLTGWKLRDARGQPCCDVIGCRIVGPDGQGAMSLCPLEGTQLSTDRGFVEYTVTRRDGQKVPVEASYGLIRDEEGELMRLVIVFRDMTRQQEHNRARAQIVANVSHELRTPLALIKGYATTLLSPGVVLDEAKTRRFLRNVGAASDRLSWMIDDLLCASRLEMQQVHLRPQLFDLCSTVRRVLTWFEPHAIHIALLADLPAGELWTWADPDRVEQVLINLLSNAVKYSPSESQIVVQAQRLGEPPRAVVHVVDEGTGIAADHLPRIFDRFYLTEESKKGIGLGLYICRELVRVMGGEIWAVSELGQGSTFSFSLPVQAEDARASDS